MLYSLQLVILSSRIWPFKRMFNLGVKEWEWFDRNPITSVPFETGVNARDRWITYEEEQKLLSHCDDWFKDFVVFALSTGLRQGEIVNLSWKNGIDLFRRTITVVKSKNDEKRTVPMNGKVYEMLKGKSKLRPIHDRVFYWMKGPLNGNVILYFFKRACERAGIEDLHFHDLRHTFATRLVLAGEDIYKVQKLLGHKTHSMTARYAHHSTESLRSTVEVLDKPEFFTNLSQMKKESVGSN